MTEGIEEPVGHDDQTGGISRRDVLKGAAAGAALVTGVTLGLGGRPAHAQGKSPGKGGPPAGVPPAPASVSDAPDLILFNGRITTFDPAAPEVEAIAIRDGKVLATGRNGQIRALGRPGKTELVDLRRRRVVPGLIEGHVHGLRNAYHAWPQTVRLDRITTRQSALEAYAAKAGELEDGKWIWTTNGGWNLHQLDVPEPFTFGELTDVAPNNPLWVVGNNAAGPRVNQATLSTLGLAPGDPGVVLDSSGHPTGQLVAPATGLASAGILAQLDSYTMEERAQYLADFMRTANQVGYTAFKDAMGNRAPWDSGGISHEFRVREPTVYLYRNGGFTCRVAYHDMSNYEGPAQAIIDTSTRVAPLGDDWFRYLGPGEDTMATDPGYSDFTRHSAAKQLSVETHVGNHNAILDGFEAANEVYPISELNWMIAHPANGEPTDEQLARGEALGIGYNLRIGGNVNNGASGARFRTVKESADVRMCLTSDGLNVAPWVPFQILFYVVTGRTLLPGVTSVPEEQQLSREEGLRHMTVDAAWSLGQEGRLGALRQGWYADLAVLTDDYFAVSDEDIYKIDSVLTIVDGRIVYASEEFTDLDPS
jgi:predicted amidohydrolase YtcJ